MPVSGAARYAWYRAWDTANNQPREGDAGNHTVQVAMDGSALAAVAATSVHVADGWYRVLVSTTENVGTQGRIIATSSTSNTEIVWAEQWENGGLVEDVLEGTLADHDEAGSLAAALITLLRKAIGPAGLDEGEGGGVLTLWEDAIDGTAREIVDITQAGDVTEWTPR